MNSKKSKSRRRRSRRSPARSRRSPARSPSPRKVTISHKGKTKTVPSRYIGSLKGADRKKQIKSIFEKTDRPRTKSPKRRSKWVVAFEKKYKVPITNKRFIHEKIITRTGIEKIIDKGRGAYYSSGSRPNQSSNSWAYARLASVILGGPARKVDRKIWDRYKR